MDNVSCSGIESPRSEICVETLEVLNPGCLANFCNTVMDVSYITTISHCCSNRR